MGSTASMLFPDIYATCKEHLTSHGLELILTQIRASVKYTVAGVATGDMTVSLPLKFPNDSYPATEIVDLPRFKCSYDVIHSMGTCLNVNEYKSFCVTLRHTLHGHLRNPHFVLLQTKEGAAKGKNS